jgi:hypothetical protein
MFEFAEWRFSEVLVLNGHAMVAETIDFGEDVFALAQTPGSRSAEWRFYKSRLAEQM